MRRPWPAAVWSQHRGAQHTLCFPYAAARAVHASLPAHGSTLLLEPSALYWLIDGEEEAAGELLLQGPSRRRN